MKYNYSVKQSDGNSFGGDVIFVNLLDQKYEKQICSDFCYDDFNSF